MHLIKIRHNDGWRRWLIHDVTVARELHLLELYRGSTVGELFWWKLCYFLCTSVSNYTMSGRVTRNAGASCLCCVSCRFSIVLSPFLRWIWREMSTSGVAMVSEVLYVVIVVGYRLQVHRSAVYPLKMATSSHRSGRAMRSATSYAPKRRRSADSARYALSTIYVFIRHKMAWLHLPIVW